MFDLCFFGLSRCGHEASSRFTRSSHEALNKSTGVWRDITFSGLFPGIGNVLQIVQQTVPVGLRPISQYITSCFRKE